MNTVESLGYLKGLLDGLDVDKKDAKVYKAIVDVLENLTKDVDDVYEELDSLEEQVDMMDEDLSELLGEDDFCSCDDEEEYETECPECGTPITVDYETLEEGGINCPNCGEYLEFDFDCECCDGEHDEEEE